MVFRYLPVLLLILLGACAPPPSPTGINATDDLGRTVLLPARILRIVSLAPSVTETVYAAGAGHLLVGVTDADDFPREVEQLERLQALPLNREALVALRPDLVLASDQVNDPRDAEALQGLGIPTWYVRIESLDDVTRAIRSLGSLLGTRPAADRVADSLDARRADLEMASTDDHAPSVLVLVGDRSLFSFGAGSYAHDLVALAGGKSITANLSTRAPVLSDEFVLDAAPEVIIGAFGPDYDPASLLEHHPSWTSVPAVQQGAVISIDPDLVLRPGPRLFEGARVLAERMRELRGGR